MVNSKLQTFWNHPAGPKTIHFWGPCFKWGISIANVADFSNPPESLSYPHQTAVAVSGLIWSRYSTQIIPKNWNLVAVNLSMFGTGMYQLNRKISSLAQNALTSVETWAEKPLTCLKEILVSLLKLCCKD